MLKPYHIEILHLALDEQFSSQALEKIIEANLKQDRLQGQIGHDEYHFDNNAFEKSYAYIEEQRALTVSSLMANDPAAAWAPFGRLTHTAQDFYAHTNYIHLWLAQHRSRASPSPSDVDPLDPHLMHSDSLRSGKIYALEALTFIRPLKPLVMTVLPRDAHAWMNLDSPLRGPAFHYAFEAAVKRTKIEFERTTKDLPGDVIALFVERKTASES